MYNSIYIYIYIAVPYVRKSSICKLLLYKVTVPNLSLAHKRRNWAKRVALRWSSYACAELAGHSTLVVCIF